MIVNHIRVISIETRISGDLCQEGSTDPAVERCSSIVNNRVDVFTQTLDWRKDLPVVQHDELNLCAYHANYWRKEGLKVYQVSRDEDVSVTVSKNDDGIIIVE